MWRKKKRQGKNKLPFNIELTLHECSFVPRITNYKEKNFEKKLFAPFLGLFKIGLISSIWFR